MEGKIVGVRQDLLLSMSSLFTHTLLSCRISGSYNSPLRKQHMMNVPRCAFCHNAAPAASDTQPLRQECSGGPFARMQSQMRLLVRER
jgi:hypothetical protein